MKQKTGQLFITLILLLLTSCQGQTTLPLAPTVEILALQTVGPPSATAEPPTELPTMTPRFPTLTETSLSGLVISSSILGAPYEVEPSTFVTPNGLGIINVEGKLVTFSDGGLFVGFSPSAVHLVYQRGIEHEYNDYVENLYVYNATTGETVELVDDLENEGGKNVLAWSPDEQTLIYYNDYETVLFEAYGYFRPKQLLIADVTTGQTRLLVQDGYQFDVSPDQRQIAYTTGQLLESKTDKEQGRSFGCFQPNIYNMDTASSQPFDVSQLTEKPVCLGYPQWSPDGDKIAWVGYFADDTFRPVVFDIKNHVGRIYEPLKQKPGGSRAPTKWFLGEPPFGGNFEPAWMDDSVFWTPSYEVNVETGEMSTPRVRKLPYQPLRNESLESPDGTLRVSLNEGRDTILVRDRDENLLASFLVDNLYDGPGHEILTSTFFQPYRTTLVSWSPFIPLANTGNP